MAASTASSSTLSGTSLPFSASEQVFSRGTPRLDGRSATAFRPIHLEVGCLPQSHGSCRFASGFCSVKAVIVQPSHSHPSEGFVTVHVDGTVHRSQADSLQTILQELISIQSEKDSPSSNSSLVIESGKYVWQLLVDVWLLKAETVEHISLAIRAAIRDTRLPKLYAEDLTVDPTQPEILLSSLSVPFVVTIACLPDATLLVDATDLERSHAKAQLHVALLNDSEVCGIRWQSHSTLPTLQMSQCIGLAVSSYKARLATVQVTEVSQLTLERDIVIR